MEKQKLITQLEKEINDYPEHVCCSCEQLHQRKSVTRVNISDNLGGEVWERLKSFILQQNPSVCDMFMCKYWKTDTALPIFTPEFALLSAITRKVWINVLPSNFLDHLYTQFPVTVISEHKLSAADSPQLILYLQCIVYVLPLTTNCKNSKQQGVFTFQLQYVRLCITNVCKTDCQSDVLIVKLLSLGIEQW